MIINFRTFLSIFMISGVLYSINSKKLKCSFTNKVDFGCSCSLYGCFATKLKIDFEDKPFDRYSGKHDENHENVDVKHLSIRDSVAHYLPRRLDLLFNLTSLLVFDSSLLKIESEDFIGLEQLEYLHLGKNFLTSIPNDAFYRLPHLKFIVLRDNHIKELVSDIFKNNLQLEHIWMYNNHIKYIGQDIFKKLKQLMFVELNSNRCLSKRYDGIHTMKQLKRDLKKCINKYEPTSKTIKYLKKELKKFKEKKESLLQTPKNKCNNKTNN